MSSPPHHVSTVAIIPARGGSKGVPGKNLRTVGGVPLVVRAVRSCLDAKTIDATYVSTDDFAIADAARHAGAEFIQRPMELAGDLANSESAVLHALDLLASQGIRPEVVLLVQCTSPFIAASDLDAAVTMITDGHADSVFSAVATYEFLWRDADPGETPGSGSMVGQNHDLRVRPRRQDRAPHFRETGAFYAMTVDGLKRGGHRFFGRTRLVEVAEQTAIEIDTAAELQLADAIASALGPSAGGADPNACASVDVDAVITDFDGVHTDDGATMDQHGVESVRISRSDGLGVARLRRLGIPMVIISTEVNPVVTARAAKLGVEVVQAVDDKQAAVRDWLASHQILPARAAYLGNDLNDQAAMSSVGWPVAVQDARPEIRQLARLVLTRRGGHGAVRELCDLIAAARAS
jgi:YrbI family 3-deoxy-D-manno-octulosonate 8-phosphate phosphatase